MVIQPEPEIAAHQPDRAIDLADARIADDMATASEQLNEMTHDVEVEMASDERDIGERVAEFMAGILLS